MAKKKVNFGDKPVKRQRIVRRKKRVVRRKKGGRRREPTVAILVPASLAFELGRIIGQLT